MNYSGNMPDWRQYNSAQPIGSEVPPVGQNANNSPIFGSNISPRRLNGPTFSPEGLNKPQNEANFNPRNFQPSPNTLNGPNVPPENPSMGSAAQMSGCHGPYRALSPRNTMIEGTVSALDSRNIPSNSLNEAIGQRNHQISINRPAAHLNCASMNGSMVPMGQRNTPTSLQAPIPMSSRQGPGSYIPCKLACCNPDANISYQSWEKFGPYPPNSQYRETNYPVDNRRFANDFENREQLGAGAYNVDARRNFPEYKYRKDTIIPRPYAPPPGVIQNYPIQNYNFPADYQKYPAYPMKEYPRESSITNPQNPGILKYQEQSVIVQQKYFTKQIQYQNGVIPKSMGPTSMESNVISRAQNPYFNPQLTRDFPQSYSDSTSLGNRGIQTTNPIQTAYPKYQMYQQKIAMQRFSMENHLRELTRIPGYQTHPKYQESVLRYRELLRLQQTVEYQSTAQDQTNVATSQVNDEIPPINLQFDQNGVLINSSFAPPGFSNIQSSINLPNSKNVQRVNNTEAGPLNLQYSEQFKAQANIDNRVQDQDPSALSQTKLPCKNEQHFSIEKDQLHGEKYESESLNIRNPDYRKTPSMHQRNSRDFADKPELDVRQFLANWDESEDEDGTNVNLPDVVLSNSTSGVAAEYETTSAVSDNPEESENCSETEDCRGTDDCRIFENTQNETKPSNSTDNKNYQADLSQGGERTKSVEEDLDISDSGNKLVRTGTVIQPTSADCDNEISLHIMENLANSRPAHDSVKLLHHETESLNNNECQELSGTVKDDVIVKKESIEEETITSIKEHIEAYNNEANTDPGSNIEEIIENDEDSRSSYGKKSSVNRKHHFNSEDDLSESCDSDSMDSHSISSYMKSPKTIKGTEIHVNAQELSAIPVSSKSDHETLDTTNIQKQNSFASEESHNPDDISLPDLPTSECTPISTTLNTPIHSDSEESSEPVIELTTPANPIEIIQYSPMLSFTHSPIKMEPYEHLDENDVIDRVSHDALDFEFQGSNSCDNDYDKLTDVSSQETEECNIPQDEGDSFDSEYSEILSEKGEQEIEFSTGKAEAKNNITDNITDQNRFAFHKENVMTTDKTNTMVNADHQPWSSVTVSEHKRPISNNTEHQDAENDTDKFETLSEKKDRLSPMPEVDKDHAEDDTFNAQNYHNISKRQTKCETEDVKSESTDNMIALNLVKDENRMKSDPIKITDESANTQVVPKASKVCPFNANEGIKHLNRSECNTTIGNRALFTSTERTVEYKSTSREEDKIYTENSENQSNFTGSLNIPLIPGEDFEEPKMPVLPMEGNCLTKIIKNTSPITDLDVLGSDDEKLDEMDDIWSEVGSVEAVDKVTDVSIDIYTGCGDGSDREKSSSSKNKSRMAQKYDWKCLKNSVKPKDPNKLLSKVYDTQEMEFKTGVENNWHLYKSSALEITRNESEPINKNFQSAITSGTENTITILEEKRNFIKVSSISRVTSNIPFRENSKQSHDTWAGEIMPRENKATEILKCKEKANHINDIASKLLENARLFEPELRKIEKQRRESSCSENSRDGSKKRIKLLKEFRKAKNKMNTDIQSIKPTDAVESNVVSSIEIIEQCKKVDVETIRVNNEIVNNQNASTDTIENVSQKYDSLIPCSINTRGCQVIQKIDINSDENRSVSTDIPMSEEKLNDGEAASENEQTPKESYSIKDYIRAEGSDNIGHNIVDTKATGTIEEDINESAINLSISSNNFGSLETLNEKSCVTNNNHDSYTSDHIEMESVKIESGTNERESYTEMKDDNFPLSQSLCPEDSGSYAAVETEDDKSIEINHMNLTDVKGDNRDSPSASTGNILIEKCILKENTEEKSDPESTKTADHEETEDLLNNPDKVEDIATSCSHSEEIIDSIDKNCMNVTTQVFETNDAQMHAIVSKENEYSPSTELVIAENKGRKPADETIDSKVTCNADDNVWNNEDSSPKETRAESLKLIESFDDNKKQSLSNHSTEHGMSIENIDTSLQKEGNVSEGVLEPVKRKIEITSVLGQERNTFELPDAQQLMELESITDDFEMRIPKTLHNLSTTDIHTESQTIPKEPEIIEKLPITHESPMENQLGECTRTEYSQNPNFAVVPPTDKNSSAIDATLEAFGLQNSVDCDFSNFDIAPNFTDTADTADTDLSNNWKYSKAYARFKDCERYKNPDNFVNPILTSLDTLDNLNTVPVYTTKDGKITYSPNPRFTYKALIIEAREREGYPTLCESYYGNSKNQESFNYPKNQASCHKRKNSDTYSYSASYRNKDYLGYYEPREHGESSTKNSPEPRNRNYYFNHNKYSHQSRDRTSRHFTPYNSDAERKYTPEKITQEKSSVKYKNRERCKVSIELDKRKNGTSDSVKSNDKKQYKQSTDQSTADSAWSGSRRHFKCDQDSTKIASSKSEATKFTNNKNHGNHDRTISTEKYMSNLENDNRSTTFEQKEKFTSISDSNKYAGKSISNISLSKTELNISSDIHFVGDKFAELKVGSLESTFQETENTNSNDQNSLQIPSHESNDASIIKPRLYPSEWEDSCEELRVQQSSSCEMKIPTESLLGEIQSVCDEETRVNPLYDEVDDIYLSKTINEDISDNTDLSGHKYSTPSSSAQSSVRTQKIEDSDYNQEKLNIDRYQSTIINAENEDASCSIATKLVQSDKDTDEQKVSELLDIQTNSVPAGTSNEIAESTQEEDKSDDPLHCTNGQPSSSYTENCAPEVKDIDHEEVVNDGFHLDKEIEFESLNQIDEVQHNLAAPNTNAQILHSSEDLCSIQEIDESGSRKPPIISKINSENKNETSVKDQEQTSSDDLSCTILKYEGASKSRSQCESYVAYSPSDESSEAMKAIPKLVIKKTESLSCKNVCSDSSSATPQDAFTEKIPGKEEYSAKVSVHPKIPKILIRNAKSRPSTPSIEEITEEVCSSVTTKEGNKVPKVKIRFEEKSPKSPIVSSNENVSKTDATETKIPKIKIKLEDRLPKVVIKNIDAETCESNEEVQKTVPKMKIKKCGGTLRQIVDTQILPVSIPRMLICTEIESEKETTPKILFKKEICKFDKNMKSITPISIQEDHKSAKDPDVKKIPKLKIKRQSSGCSIEMHRKRHSVSPVQSELKKMKKSSKLAEPNDKKQFNKLSMGFDQHNSLKKLDMFSVKQSYELAISENIKYEAAAQSPDCVRGEQTKSAGGNTSENPEEIPKVIIKRVSPSAEFKCELSKVRRDAIIKNKRWQPEVKLQRSWVLDCMAKDLNLDKLRLKVATPDSMLKKSLLQKEPELGAIHMKNGKVNRNQSDKKLFRSKSTSELVPTHGSIGIVAEDDVKQLGERNATNLPREFITPKRCKSELFGMFSKCVENFVCKKKLRNNNHVKTLQVTSNPAFNNANEFANSSNIQSVKEQADMVKYWAVTDIKNNLNINGIQSYNEVVHVMETSGRGQQEAIAENMNVEKDDSMTKMDNILPNNSTTARSVLDCDLNSKLFSRSTNTTNPSKSRYECYENSNESTKILTNNWEIGGDDNSNVNHAVLKGSVIIKNTTVDSIKRNSKSGKRHAKEIRNNSTEKNKNAEMKGNETSSIKGMSTHYVDKEKTLEISSAQDKIEQSKINAKVPKSVIRQALISEKSDINILENDSEIHSSGVVDLVDDLQTTNRKSNLHTLDINATSGNNVRKGDDNNVVSENWISHVDIVEQENTSMLNGKVLTASDRNNSKSTYSDPNNVQDSKVDIILNNSSENLSNIDSNSLKKAEFSEEKEAIIKILSMSPSLNQTEVGIQLCPDVLEEHGMCLYHEDAIPTQFELELEIIDNTVPDPLEVPMPRNDPPIEKFHTCSGDELSEDSHQLTRILNDSEDSVNCDDLKSGTTLSEENNSHVSFLSTHQEEVFADPDKQDIILSTNIDEWKIARNMQTKTTKEFNSNIQKPLSSADLLVKEVLAAKEKLRKCLGKSKNESKIKVKARPKTAAEKKQGLSFDLNTIASCEESFTKSKSHSWTNFIADANSSKQVDQNLSSVNNNEKFYQNKTKTEFNINKIKSEIKHSKDSKNSVLRKKYSTLPKIVEKYTNLTQGEGYLIPNNSSIDIKDRVEFGKGETTISLRNSKYLIKNNSYSDTRKKTSELINSKDSKCRSKSSRYDVNSKHVGKSKSNSPSSALVQESSLDFSQSEEKPVSDAAKNNNYKSPKTSLEQNVNSMTEKPKFKLYKIPKITKPTHPENERLSEDLRESFTKEAGMPILEPQIDLNGGLEVSDLNSNCESSRSPPMITNQEIGVDCQAPTDSLECIVSLNKEKEVLSRQKTMLLQKEMPEAVSSFGEETTVADIVNDMAYHEKATIRHRRYCTLCERWFPTVARYRRHLTGYQHRHTELTQRRTIHTLFTLFTGRPCPRLQPPGEVRIDCEPGELTPLQIAVQGVTKNSNKADGNTRNPTREDK